MSIPNYFCKKSKNKLFPIKLKAEKNKKINDTFAILPNIGNFAVHKKTNYENYIRGFRQLF